METEREWEVVRGKRKWDVREAGMGLLRFSLLFGLCVAALAALAMPTLYRKSQSWADGAVRPVDQMRVGSVGQHETYTLRKSVLQPSPNSVCMIRSNGTRSGEC